MEYTVLVIDDDEPVHIMSKWLLGEEFNLLHAKNAQDAIDILSEEQVNLILSDIHMPGLSGLEFLESLMKDAEKNQIPVLIMTNLPTVEKEKKALDLGAADFIDKSLFNEDKEEVLERVRMKLVTNITDAPVDSELASKKEKFVSQLMVQAIQNNFDTTSQTLCEELKSQFAIEFVSMWTMRDGEPVSQCYAGNSSPEGYTPEDLKNERSFQELTVSREAYMTNNVFNDEMGIMTNFSRDYDLSAEIGVPLFAINERNLLMNDMTIPEDAEFFGCVILKRNKLFSSTEFEILSRLLIQSGSILWRLYSDK